MTVRTGMVIYWYTVYKWNVNRRQLKLNYDELDLTRLKNNGFDGCCHIIGPLRFG